MVTSCPPRNTCNSQLPNNGTDLTMFVPTVVAKYASLFHGSRYPEKPNPIVSRNNRYPETQVTSRGGRYAFNIIVLNIWSTSEMIIRCALQLCTDRISQPNG